MITGNVIQRPAFVCGAIALQSARLAMRIPLKFWGVTQLDYVVTQGNLAPALGSVIDEDYSTYLTDITTNGPVQLDGMHDVHASDITDLIIQHSTGWFLGVLTLVKESTIGHHVFIGWEKGIWYYFDALGESRLIFTRNVDDFQALLEKSLKPTTRWSLRDVMPKFKTIIIVREHIVSEFKVPHINPFTKQKLVFIESRMDILVGGTEPVFPIRLKKEIPCFTLLALHPCVRNLLTIFDIDDNYPMNCFILPSSPFIILKSGDINFTFVLTIRPIYQNQVLIAYNL